MWAGRAALGRLLKVAVLLAAIAAFFGAMPPVRPAMAAGGGTARGSMVVRAGAYENPPKVFTGPGGRVAGIFPDLLARVAAEEGWEIQWVHGGWEECLERLERGEIDLMVDMAYSEERARRFDFSAETIFVNWGMLYARPDLVVESFLDLANLRVAVMRGSIHTEGSAGIRATLERFDVPARFIEAADYAEVFDLLERGEADAGVVNRLFGRLNAPAHRVRATSVIFNPRHLRFAFSRAAPSGPFLKERIDRRLSEMKARKDSAFFRILNRHLAQATDAGGGDEAVFSPDQRLPLSPEEADWIRDHPVIRLGVDPEFAPFEYISEDGRHMGMAADYVRIISRRLGIEFAPVAGLSWAEAMARARAGRIDALACVGVTEERKRHFIYLKPYLSFPRVIITRRDSTIAGMGDLRGRRVGAQAESSHHGFLLEQTRIEPILFDTFKSALMALSDGRVEAVIGNLGVASHAIGELRLADIRIAGRAGGADAPLTFAVRRDWPILAGLIERALASIPEAERDAIQKRWIPVDYAPGIDYAMLARVLAPLLAVVGMVLYWNRRLRREVAARKTAQAALREAKEAAERANRAKSVFLANMSHEIRTPMNAILGYAQLMRGDADLTEEQRGNLEIINRAGEHLLALINDVLEMSRIEAGRVTVSPGVFDPGALLADIVLMFAAPARARGLSLSRRCSDAVPSRLLADEGKIRQILINLLGNAVKFTPEGRIEAAMDVERAADGSMTLTVAVTDTGMGIAEAELETIFGSFEQKSGDRNIEGTGLGLAISRRYARLLGGDIRAESRAGRGSIFTVRLPVAEAGAEPESRPPPEEFRRLPPGAPEWRILVVDDKKTNRDILEKFLTRAGYTVATAENGAEAMDLHAAFRPHAILLDIRMPVMDGVAVTRRIKSLPDGGGAAIIAVSASALEEERLAVLEYGADEFIRKPFREAEVLGSLARHLSLSYDNRPDGGEASADAAALAALSPERIERMRAATEGGYMDRLSEEIAAVAEEDPALGRALAALARGYEYDRLAALFDGAAADAGRLSGGKGEGTS